jgi:hypothetical protein
MVGDCEREDAGVGGGGGGVYASVIRIECIDAYRSIDTTAHR